MGFAGLNITFPCKQAVIPLLDALSDEARAIGAVNTVVREGDRLVGYNTDGSGLELGLPARAAAGGPVARGAARRGRRRLGRAAYAALRLGRRASSRSSTWIRRAPLRLPRA